MGVAHRVGNDRVETAAGFSSVKMVDEVCDVEPGSGGWAIAKKDLAPGQIVLLESPLVSGPGRNGKPICLACYRLLHCYTSPSMRCSDDTILKEVGPSHQI